MTVTTVAEYGLGIQAWAGPTKPDYYRSIRPARTGIPTSKPSDGFFTSTWNAKERTSAWTEFMRTQGTRGAENRSLWLLTPDPTAMLFIVENEEDFGSLVEDYASETDGRRTMPAWHLLANSETKPFDAVHVTETAATASSANPFWKFSGWGCESTLWLAMRFVAFPGCEGRISEEWRVL